MRVTASCLDRNLFLRVAVFAGMLVPGIGFRSVEAAQYHVTSRTIGDMYSHLRASWDDSDPIERHRIHQLLGVNAYDLTGDGSHRVRFVSQLRIDADFGVNAAQQEQQEGLSQTDFALLYGYVDVQRWLGVLDVRLGRQMEVDAIDMLLFDGARFRAYTPWYVGVEALGGLEAIHKQGPTLNPATVDGTPGGPLLLEGRYGAIEPRFVMGAGLFLHNLQYTQLDLNYRRVQTLGDSNLSEEIGEAGINQERVGLAASQRILEGLFVNGGGSYDFFLGGLNELLGGIRYRPVFLVETEVKYHYLLPSFDAESIWNIFSWRPMDRFEERVRLYGSEDTWVHVGAYQSFFRADDSVTNEPVESVVQDLGFTVGGWTKIQPDVHLRADFTTEFGYGGRQTFVDFGGGKALLDGSLELDGRVLMVLFEDAQQARLNGTLWGAQIGGTWHFMSEGALSLLVEEASAELQPHWLRVMTVLDLGFWM